LGVNCLAQGQNSKCFHAASSGIQTKGFLVTGSTLLTSRLPGTDWDSGNSGKYQMGWTIVLLCGLVTIDTHKYIFRFLKKWLASHFFAQFLCYTNL
jgi:hypothetical protein